MPTYAYSITSADKIGSIVAAGTIDGTHPKYNSMLPKVQKVRAFCKSDVKRTPFLRKLPGHEESDFELYCHSAYYLPATPRTVDAFTGLIMLEVFKHGVTEKMQPFVDDVTNDGEPLDRVAARVVREIVISGRCFILTDYPTVDENLSRLELEAIGARPYWTLYKFEDVFNWKTETIDGQKVLSQVRLWETYTHTDPDNEWDTEERRQIRVIDLVKDDSGKSRIVRSRVYRESDKTEGGSSDKQKSKKTDKAWELAEISFPKIRGEYLDRIPGVMIGTDTLDPGEVDIPPLNELVDANCSHLIDSANRQWALMWCGSPIAWIADDGMRDNDNQTVRLGSSTFLIMGSDANAGVIELGKDGVGALKEAMDDKRRDMAAIGARILTDGGSQQISTETALLERAGEHSVLHSISSAVSDGISRAFRTLIEWAGMVAPSDLKVELNKDFVPTGLTTGQLTEWVDAMLKGTIPLTVLFRKLKEAKELPPDMTEEAFIEGLMALEELGIGMPSADREDDEDDESDEDDDEDDSEEDEDDDDEGDDE